ncbi:hypothetical protein Adeg_1357 [Ammonifex degensii KC4]|uniref:Uncharacterized protein n=1 Tax=Ammonifex degensii (strain DSM 10501 / KC4) TaxID=429009 RepID=C9R831_AMMDK|nr:hypothetical protein [Ammonifex degensii]ACX52460.1 hypothetical protein Adeg_1357 [Ammonifex degensii KC4]
MSDSGSARPLEIDGNPSPHAARIGAEAGTVYREKAGLRRDNHAAAPRREDTRSPVSGRGGSGQAQHPGKAAARRLSTADAWMAVQEVCREEGFVTASRLREALRRSDAYHWLVKFERLGLLERVPGSRPARWVMKD